jgi:hypothetical protein
MRGTQVRFPREQEEIRNLFRACCEDGISPVIVPRDIAKLAAVHPPERGLVWRTSWKTGVQIKKNV